MFSHPPFPKGVPGAHSYPSGGGMVVPVRRCRSPVRGGAAGGAGRAHRVPGPSGAAASAEPGAASPLPAGEFVLKK